MSAWKIRSSGSESVKYEDIKAGEWFTFIGDGLNRHPRFKTDEGHTGHNGVARDGYGYKNYLCEMLKPVSVDGDGTIIFEEVGR